VSPRTDYRSLLGCVLALALMLACAIPHESGAKSEGPVRLLSKARSAVWPAQCGSDGSRCLRELTLPGGARLAAYSNVPMTGSARVTHAMLVVHGAGRDAAVTFTGMMQAAVKAGADVEQTMVLAPWFKTAQDSPASGEAVWSSGGWKIGDPSTGRGGEPISSFQVADDLLYTWADRTRFPNLRWVTVVGHSAGGQFTDRYATFGQAPGRVPGVLVNFIVANPSSFVYFDQQRPNGNPSSCAGYDTYKYGMAGRSGYVAQMSPRQALTTFLSRRVSILNGSADTVQNGDMDEGCGGMLQGANRLARGENFFARMRSIAPSAPHDRIVVPGVTHDHYALFEDPRSATVLFGTTAPARE
jgi:pimeloyl-ACP methyl ester carboxylesterase